MFDDRQATSTCEHCGHVNEVSLSHFAGTENIFDNRVVAICQSCSKNIIVDLYQAYID